MPLRPVKDTRSYHLPPGKGPPPEPGHASTLITVGSQHQPSCELHGSWFTPHAPARARTHTLTHSHTHTRKGQGSGHGPNQARTMNQISCPGHTSPWATAAAPPSGVRTHRRGPQPTFQVVFCLLTKLTSSSDRGGKCRLLRALVSTSRQLRVAKSCHILETGSEIHLEKKGHKTSSVCFFLRFKCSTHTRRHLRMCCSGGLVPSSPCCLPPHAPGLRLPEPGCQQSASGAPAPVGSHALSQSPSACPQHTGLHDGLNVCPPPTNSSSNPTPGGDGVRRWGLWGNDEVMRVEPYEWD